MLDRQLASFNETDVRGGKPRQEFLDDIGRHQDVRIHDNDEVVTIGEQPVVPCGRTQVGIEEGVVDGF